MKQVTNTNPLNTNPFNTDSVNTDSVNPETINTGSISKTSSSLAVLLLSGVLGATNAYSDQHGMTDMTMPDRPTMDRPAMDSQNTDMSGMDMSGMDMSNPNASAPKGTRDPHVYSGGYTLDSGPYALKGPRQLVLADEHTRWNLLFERLEYSVSDEESDLMTFDGQLSWGWDYDKVILRSEGEVEEGTLVEQSSELVWSHAVDAFWDSQLGARFDSGLEQDQSWVTAGFKGTAPYWFDVSAMLSLSSEGQSALDLEAEYEWLFTQRLILQTRLEASAYGSDDDAREVARGPSSMAAGLRLRYEITRQFAPYIGVEWQESIGNTRSLLRDEGEATGDTLATVGVRFWL